MLKLFARVLTMLFVVCLSSQFVIAQDTGELNDVEIEIVRERLITLPTASRNFEKIPPRPSEVIKAPVQYEFKPFNFQTTQITPALKPLKLKQEESTDVNTGYVSVGYGNYASPFLEAMINSGKDKNKLVGAHGLLNSSDKGPVDGRNSGSGLTMLSLYGRTFSETVSLSGDVGFENRTTHFYGYPAGIRADIDPKSIKQSYSKFSLKGELSNAKASDLSYKLGGLFSYLSDKYNARESEVDVSFSSRYRISDVSGFAIKAGYVLLNRKDSLVEALPRHLFQVTPSLQFAIGEEFKFSAGLTGAYENDSINTKDFHVYPDVQMSYPITPAVELTASLTGGIDKVSLQTLSNENIWIAPNIPIFHTNRLYDLQAAIHTRVGNKVAVQGGFSFAALKNWYFFMNEEEDQSKFTLQYDDKATLRSDFFASLGYTHAQKVNILLRGDYYAYDRAEGKAWHKPTFKLTGDVSFNVVDKILFDIKLLAQGGMVALDPVTDSNVKLDNALDLNVRTEYLISDKFSAFVQLNNILSSNYPLFLYYPARGFQATGGITWNF